MVDTGIYQFWFSEHLAVDDLPSSESKWQHSQSKQQVVILLQSTPRNHSNLIVLNKTTISNNS